MILGSVGIYALALSSLFATFVTLTYVLPVFLHLQRAISLFTTKILYYTFVLRRHKWLGPWTVVAVVAQGTYIIANLTSLLFRVSSFSEVALRAGKLALINLLPLFLSPNLGFLADLFGISLRSLHQVYRSFEGMSFALTLVHVCPILLRNEQRDLYTFMVQLYALIKCIVSDNILRVQFRFYCL
jgi:hypothetical protein